MKATKLLYPPQRQASTTLKLSRQQYFLKLLYPPQRQASTTVLQAVLALKAEGCYTHPNGRLLQRWRCCVNRPIKKLSCYTHPNGRLLQQRKLLPLRRPWTSCYTHPNGRLLQHPWKVDLKTGQEELLYPPQRQASTTVLFIKVKKRKRSCYTHPNGRLLQLLNTLLIWKKS